MSKAIDNIIDALMSFAGIALNLSNSLSELFDWIARPGCHEFDLSGLEGLSEAPDSDAIKIYPASLISYCLYTLDSNA